MNLLVNWEEKASSAIPDGTHILWDPRATDHTVTGSLASYLHINKPDNTAFKEILPRLGAMGAIEKDMAPYIVLNPAVLLDKVRNSDKAGDDYQLAHAMIHRLDQLLQGKGLPSVEATMQADSLYRNREYIRARLTSLREEMGKQGMQAWLQPLADEFFNEFPPEGSNRFKYLTGFDCTMGTLVVPATGKAAMFLDGRYAEKARRYLAQAQLADHIEVVEVPSVAEYSSTIGNWFKGHNTPNETVGVDPHLHTQAELDGLLQAANAGAAPNSPRLTFKKAQRNLVDAVWGADAASPRPAIVKHPITDFLQAYTGDFTERRIKQIAKELDSRQPESADYMVISDPSSLAWLLNIRGDDTLYAPLTLSIALLSRDGKVELYTDAPLTPEARQHLESLDCVIYPTRELEPSIKTLIQNSDLKDKAGAPIVTSFLVDPDTQPAWFSDTVKKYHGKLVSGGDLILPHKIRKNPTELECIRRAHVQDGIAMTKLLHWIETKGKTLPPEERTEARFVEQSLHFRKERPGFVKQSFKPISAAGENAPIVHYFENTGAINEQAGLYLLDSGAHYYNGDAYKANPDPHNRIAGTTDITRVVALKQPPSPEHKKAYTLVLKGHIALAAARFDNTTKSIALDEMTRGLLKADPQFQAINPIGYSHGAGHGVGYFSAVHEMPPRLTYSGDVAQLPLADGMVVSNEPGYYDAKTHTGVRIENLMAVQAHPQDRTKFSFETLTLAPLDLSLIDASLLSEREINWINDYHARVRKEIGPHLDAAEYAWLEKATKPLPPRPVKLSEYQPPEYDVPTVNMHFDIRSESQVVLTNTSRYYRKEGAAAKPLVLHGCAKPFVRLQSLTINGVKLNESQYHLDPHTGDLIIDRAPMLLDSKTSQFDIEIVSEINPKANTTGEGLYYGGKGDKGMISTQCESEGFRNMTWALDRPDIFSKYTVTIEADKEQYPHLLSNGIPAQSQDVDGGRRHRVTWTDAQPKPCYLFALAALQGDVVKDRFDYPGTLGGVDLYHYTNKGWGERAHFAQAKLKDAMAFAHQQWDDIYRGTHFQGKTARFSTLGVPAFNMGAMENTGLNIFNDARLLVSKDTATDAAHFNVDRVVAHEYFHDITGNWRVPANWFQIAYKEGLTVFRDQKYTEAKYDAAWQRIHDVTELRTRVFGEDEGAMTHPIILPEYTSIMNNYDALTYPKGAQVNRMIETLVGEKPYWDAYKKFHHDGDQDNPKSVTIPEYFNFIGQQTGKQALIQQFAESWTTQSGIPTLRVSGHYDAAAKTYTLTVKQELPKGATKPFVMPFKVGLVTRQGEAKDIPLHCNPPVRKDGVLELTQLEHSFTFQQVEQKPLLSLNRDFTAYGKIAYDEKTKPSAEELALLAARDPNGFKRWDALQEIGIGVLQEFLDAKRTGKPFPDTSSGLTALIGAYRSTLENKQFSPLLKSELLRLPEESALINLQPKGTVDPVAVHEAWEAVRKTVAKQLIPELEHTYHGSQSTQGYVFNAEEMGRRALMNLCLGHLMQVDPEKYGALAEQQFDANHNFNDRAAALQMLADTPDKTRLQSMLGDIESAHKQDHLVMNQWMNWQARAQYATADEIRAIAKSPYFDAETANCVYALLGGLRDNTTLFHAPDGSGYRLLGELLAQVDQKNPQAAARVAKSAFSSISLYEAPRRDNMIAAIEQIRADRSESLSKELKSVLSSVEAAYEAARKPVTQVAAGSGAASALQGTSERAVS